MHGTRLSRNRVPCKKKNCKCDHPIFREPYSGVFKPYSDVLKPYSGVFLKKKKFISPHTGFKEPYSGVFKPYSDILKPYSGVLELDFPKIEFHVFFFL